MDENWVISKMAVIVRENRFLPNVILTCKLFYGIMYVIQGDLQGQSANLKGKFLKIIFVTNTNMVSPP